MLAIFLLCIFLTGGVYTPYSPCMSTPLLTRPDYYWLRPTQLVTMRLTIS